MRPSPLVPAGGTASRAQERPSSRVITSNDHLPQGDSRASTACAFSEPGSSENHSNTPADGSPAAGEGVRGREPPTVLVLLFSPPLSTSPPRPRDPGSLPALGRRVGLTWGGGGWLGASQLPSWSLPVQGRGWHCGRPGHPGRRRSLGALRDYSVAHCTHRVKRQGPRPAGPRPRQDPRIGPAPRQVF